MTGRYRPPIEARDAMLTIDITSLSTGIHHLERAPSASDVGLDPTTYSDIEVAAELQYHRDRILVSLTARATAELICDRTLEPYDQPVEGEYSVLFGPPSMVGEEGDKFEEVRPLDASDRELDITDIVRDTILLSLPQRRVAPGAEDEPIDREFGAAEDDEETPVDPRWSKLEELKDGGESDE